MSDDIIRGLAIALGLARAKQNLDTRRRDRRREDEKLQYDRDRQAEQDRMESQKLAAYLASQKTLQELNETKLSQMNSGKVPVNQWSQMDPYILNILGSKGKLEGLPSSDFESSVTPGSGLPFLPLPMNKPPTVNPPNVDFVKNALAMQQAKNAPSAYDITGRVLSGYTAGGPEVAAQVADLFGVDFGKNLPPTVTQAGQQGVADRAKQSIELRRKSIEDSMANRLLNIAKSGKIPDSAVTTLHNLWTSNKLPANAEPKWLDWIKTARDMTPAEAASYLLAKSRFALSQAQFEYDTSKDIWKAGEPGDDFVYQGTSLAALKEQVDKAESDYKAARGLYLTPDNPNVQSAQKAWEESLKVYDEAVKARAAAKQQHAGQAPRKPGVNPYLPGAPLPGVLGGGNTSIVPERPPAPTPTPTPTPTPGPTVDKKKLGGVIKSFAQKDKPGMGSSRVSTLRQKLRESGIKDPKQLKALTDELMNTYYWPTYKNRIKSRKK